VTDVITVFPVFVQHVSVGGECGVLEPQRKECSKKGMVNCVECCRKMNQGWTGKWAWD